MDCYWVFFHFLVLSSLSNAMQAKAFLKNVVWWWICLEMFWQIAEVSCMTTYWTCLGNTMATKPICSRRIDWAIVSPVQGITFMLCREPLRSLKSLCRIAELLLILVLQTNTDLKLKHHWHVFIVNLLCCHWHLQGIDQSVGGIVQ